MTTFPPGRFCAVYVIYDADVLSYRESFIEAMSPAAHLPAGYPDGWRKRVREIVASRFVQTEGNEQYDFGYLGKEHNPPHVSYFPYGAIDERGTLPEDACERDQATCARCGERIRFAEGAWLDNTDGEGDTDDYGQDGEHEPVTGQGQHRKWVAELSRAEWLIFAHSYCIDLDADGYPAQYEETMGSLTEHGHLEAVAVDNRDGWQDGHGEVISSQMYVSFAYPQDPDGEPS